MTSRSTRSTGRRASVLERGAPAGRGQHLVALAPEAAGEHVAVVLVVVHDQDDVAVRRRLTGARPQRSPAGALVRRRHAAVAQQLVEALGGRADAIEVGQQRAGARLRRPAAQGLAAERMRSRSGRSVPRAAATSGGPVCPAPAPRSAGPGAGERRAERREPGGQVGLVAVLQLLEEHLGVADDVVQRRAQLVAELRAGSMLTRRPPARAAPRSSRAAGRGRSAWCRSRRSPPPRPFPGRRPWRAPSARSRECSASPGRP